MARRRLVFLTVGLTLQEGLSEFLDVFCVAESDVGLGLLDRTKRIERRHLKLHELMQEATTSVKYVASQY